MPFLSVNTKLSSEANTLIGVPYGTLPCFKETVVDVVLKSRLVIVTLAFASDPLVVTSFVAGRVASVSLSLNLKFGNLVVSSVTFTFFVPKSLFTVSAFFTAADKSASDKASVSLKVILFAGTETIFPVY